jgi:hypothetical protein
MKGNLTIALDPDCQPADVSWKDFRANFFQDKNRLIPNDQELTRWMKKQINDYYDRHECYKDWNRIQFYKIFVNPKTLNIQSVVMTKKYIILGILWWCITLFQREIGMRTISNL